MTMLSSFVVTFAIVKVLDVTMKIRVSPDVEAEGLDLNEHAETAYNMSERAMGRAH